MGYQPIKFKKAQYLKLKNIVKRDWGNVSIPKGIFIITFLYDKYIPNHIKKMYRKKWYQPTNLKRRNIRWGKT